MATTNVKKIKIENDGNEYILDTSIDTYEVSTCTGGFDTYSQSGKITYLKVTAGANDSPSTTGVWNIMQTGSGDYGWQMAMQSNSEDVHFRRKYTGTWNAWKKLALSVNATQSAAGLMSASDKTKLDGVATGATANTGTITGITMNGASKGTSGVVDLGTVITAHQDISGKKNTQTAVSDPTASGTGVTFIDTISQNTQGVISPHKRTVRTMGACTSSANGSTGLVPAPPKGTPGTRVLHDNGEWGQPLGGIQWLEFSGTTSAHGNLKVSDTLGKRPILYVYCTNPSSTICLPYWTGGTTLYVHFMSDAKTLDARASQSVQGALAYFV